MATVPTLSGEHYLDDDLYRREIDALFGNGWAFVGHQNSFPPGSKRAVELGGESVIISRDRNGSLRALANVCRHRGARLCPPTAPTDLAGQAGPASIQCPYHSWTYSLDGSLVATPRVDPAEFNRADHGLWRYRLDTWNGLVFVSLGTPEPGTAASELATFLGRYSPGLVAFADMPVGDYHLGRRTFTSVEANWKIIVENYLECLHCPTVHPELVDVVPLYRTGAVVDPTRTDGAVVLTGGGNSFSATAVTDLPRLPGFDPGATDLYRGSYVCPNLFVDVTSTSFILTALFPEGPDRTLVMGEYLFAPDVAQNLDGAATGMGEIVEFSELVGRQDYEVCELVQKGVSSRAFTTGILVDKDAEVVAFNRMYREAMIALDGGG